MNPGTEAKPAFRSRFVVMRNMPLVVSLNRSANGAARYLLYSIITLATHKPILKGQEEREKTITQDRVYDGAIEARQAQRLLVMG